MVERSAFGSFLLDNRHFSSDNNSLRWKGLEERPGRGPMFASLPFLQGFRLCPWPSGGASGLALQAIALGNKESCHVFPRDRET